MIKRTSNFYDWQKKKKLLWSKDEETKWISSTAIYFVFFVWWSILGRMIMAWMQVLQNIWCQSGCTFLVKNSDAKTFLEIHIERWTRKQSRGLLKKFLELFSCQSLILVYLKFDLIPPVIALAGISKVGWPWRNKENGALLAWIYSQ